MANLKWLESMSVGVPQFDEAHKGYMAVLNAIAIALDQADLAEADRLCANFLDLATEHGRQEEAFLRRKKFPRLQTIIEAQQATLAKIEALAANIRHNPEAARHMVEDMMQAVVTYLLHGDINFKSFVQNLADEGHSIDPFAQNESIEPLT